MKLGLFLASWLAVSSPAIAQTFTGQLFSCLVLTRGALTDDGRLAPNNLQKSLASIQTQFLYDDSTQVLRWEAGNEPWEYRRLQEGSTQNGLVAVRIYPGTSQTVVDVLRIKTYLKNWPFMLIEGDEVYTGTCKRY